MTGVEALTSAKKLRHTVARTGEVQELLEVAAREKQLAFCFISALPLAPRAFRIDLQRPQLLFFFFLFFLKSAPLCGCVLCSLPQVDKAIVFLIITHNAGRGRSKKAHLFVILSQPVF